MAILIVDDEIDIASTLGECLIGWDPIICCSLDLARANIDLHRHKISSVISDVKFHQKNEGLSVYSYSRDKLGMIPFIFYSASSHDIPPSIHTDPFVKIIEKTASIVLVEDELRAMLNLSKSG